MAGSRLAERLDEPKRVAVQLIWCFRAAVSFPPICLTGPHSWLFLVIGMESFHLADLWLDRCDRDRRSGMYRNATDQDVASEASWVL